jgi:hypothetical protein
MSSSPRHNEAQNSQLPKFLKLSAFAAVLAVAALVLTNCGDAKKDSAVSVAPADVYAILSTACIQCHQPGGSATANYNVTLDFATAALAYSTLTTSGVNSALTASSCVGVKQVVAANPTNSYLLAATVPGYAHANFAGVTGCSPSAHLTSQSFNLTAAQQNTLISWVQNGAKSQ